MAILACETGIAPDVLLVQDPIYLDAMIAHLIRRAEKSGGPS